MYVYVEMVEEGLSVHVIYCVSGKGKKEEGKKELCLSILFVFWRKECAFLTLDLVLKQEL